MTGYGNVDTEAGDQGQPFPTLPSSGNVQSDTANVNYALGMGRTYAQPDPMQQYFQLGQQLLQQQMAMQQQQPQQMQASPQGTSMPQGNLALDSGMLTAGFNPDWLAQRLDAASSNGAAIGGMGKNPGQGSIAGGGKSSGGNLPAGGTSAGWETPTVKSFSGMAGAGRLI